MFGIRPLDWSKLARNPKNNNDVTIFWHDVIVKFFQGCFVSLVKFSYCSKFQVNIITGSTVMTIMAKNLEIRNNPTWILPKIWRLGRVMDSNFDTDVSKSMLLNDTKCQGYSQYRFWVIKAKLTGGGGRITPPSHHPPRLRLK